MVDAELQEWIARQFGGRQRTGHHLGTYLARSCAPQGKDDRSGDSGQQHRIDARRRQVDCLFGDLLAQRGVRRVDEALLEQRKQTGVRSNVTLIGDLDRCLDHLQLLRR